MVKIVESEGCAGPDDANYAYWDRPTTWTKLIFWQGETSHIFLIYIIYHCFNVVVVNKVDYPSVILIQTIEVLSKERFENFISNPKITNGPGRLSKYFIINKKDDALNFLEDQTLYLVDEYESIVEAHKIISILWINVNYPTNSKEMLFRFYIKNNKTVSRK